MSDIVCDICPHHCLLKEGRTGFCRARMNKDGKNVCLNYGKLTSMAIDPVEKKPLAGFYPGTYILSLGSYGCSLACPFCQNHAISMHGEGHLRTLKVMPEELLDIALHHPESIGAAFTYNEPLIAWEYVLDCAKLLKQHDLKVVLVTNGCAEQHILEKVIPYTDAVNIDLKGDREFYKELSGDYDTVKNTIAYCAKRCHTEVTTLVIPGKSDDPEWIAAEAQWLAGIDPDMILHLSRYFPAYRYEIPATPKQTMYELQKKAGTYLNNVLLGNVW